MCLRAHKRQLKAIGWMETNVCVCVHFLFVELKVVGSFGSTEASAREFLEIEGSWVFGIEGSKCMCACVCVSVCNSCL